MVGEKNTNGAFARSFGTLPLLLVSVRVRIAPDGTHIERRILLFRWRKFVPANEIQAVQVEIGMRAGNRFYWNLLLISTVTPPKPSLRKPGVRIWCFTRDKGKAEQLAALVSTELGRTP